MKSTGQKIDHGLSFNYLTARKQNDRSHVSDVTKRTRIAWISAIRRTDMHFADIPRSLKLCSRHFYSGKPAEMDESHPDWTCTWVTLKSQPRHQIGMPRRHHLRESEGRGQNEQNNMNKDERDGVQEDAEAEGYWDQAESGAAEEEEHRKQTDTDKPAAKRLMAGIHYTTFMHIFAPISSLG